MNPSTEPRQAGQRRLWSGLVAGGGLLLTGLLTFSNGRGPACLFRLTTGVPCPGCGLTRSISALWHADLPLSLRYHPLGLFVFLLAWLVLLAALLPPQRTTPTSPLLERVLTFLAHPRFLWTLVGTLLGVWGLRLLLAGLGNGLFLW